MKHIWGVAFIVAFFALGCSKNKESTKRSPDIYFNAVSPGDSGIKFTNKLRTRGDLNIIEYLYYYNGGGVAIGDINNDGLEDVYLTANQTSDRLYLNLGNLKFKDITKEAGINTDSTWSTGVTMEDINNDGFIDIYVSKVGKYKSLKAHNQLYINNGDSSFTESSEKYGLDFSGLSTQASFFDYDKDGDMDVYLMNHSVHTIRSYGSIEKRYETDSLAGDRFYENKLNEGLEKFIDVTEASGIYSSALGYGLALTTSDINNDGFIDIYVGNDFHENDYLYINQGNKTFKESGSDYLDHTTRFTMGVDISDLNNDGLFDIYSLDMMPYDHEIFMKSGGEDSDKVSQIKENFGFQTQYARNMFQLNTGGHSFSEVALMTNTHASDWSWSVLLQDYDNDGLNDIFITNGIYKRPNDLDYINYLSNVDFAEYSKTQQNEIEQKLIDQMPSIKIPNIIFRNKGDLEFDKLTDAAGFTPSYSNGAAYGDLDNDGDLDLIVNNLNQVAVLFENQSSENNKDNNYISIGLKGNSIYKNPSGSRVYVYAGGHTFVKELTPTKGFQSSSSRNLHFGLGTTTKIDSIEIQWLDGKTQTEKGLAVNQHHSIGRKQTSSSGNTLAKPPPDSLQIFPYTHLENNYLDYDREPLIPERLSAEGPALVQADFNGDGLEDLYIGGAKYQPPTLLLQNKNGAYIEDKKSDFIKDISYEDVDATAFDIDNDGDLDLYVMSGGNEKIEGDESLEDRIYINNGHGVFERLNVSLFRTNGGSVTSADYDGDGFDDLFIGNRSIPGGYGLSPYSFILKNNGKNDFSIVNKTRLGMVTHSQWADINNDKLLDLIVVGDWMPITILINKDNASFEDETKKYGLEHTNGMWNVLLVSDLDGNGQMDIAAGNAGLNFKFKASEASPVQLYLDDFDSNGQLDPIIYYKFFNSYVPFASKDKLVSQLPSLKKKFLSYAEFSKVSSIENLCGKKESEILEIKHISELRSMVYFNPGSGIEKIPMPKEAQMSSIEDLFVENTQDGAKLVFVGNYLDYTTELGQSSANSGGIVTFTAEGRYESFTYLPLPTALNSRKIKKLGENNFLVITNNDKAYTFELPNF